MPAGRPTKYDPEKHPQLAYEFCAENGFTDKKLAKAFAVDVATVNKWKKEYPEFYESVKRGKDIFDTGKVENSLLRRSKGFMATEKTFEQIFNKTTNKLEMVETKRVKKLMAPDPTSMIFWLKNRNPERWRDKQDVKLEGDLNINLIDSFGKDE